MLWVLSMCSFYGMPTGSAVCAYELSTDRPACEAAGRLYVSSTPYYQTLNRPGQINRGFRCYQHPANRVTLTTAPAPYVMTLPTSNTPNLATRTQPRLRAD